jgi:hypothetical protein
LDYKIKEIIQGILDKITLVLMIFFLDRIRVLEGQDIKKIKAF